MQSLLSATFAVLLVLASVGGTPNEETRIVNHGHSHNHGHGGRRPGGFRPGGFRPGGVRPGHHGGVRPGNLGGLLGIFGALGGGFGGGNFGGAPGDGHHGGHFGGVHGGNFGGNHGGHFGGGHGGHFGGGHGHHDEGCRYWCRTNRGQFYCCEDGDQVQRPVGIKPGQCPPVRPVCPPTRSHGGPPRTCSNDGSCPGVQKCCFDTCLGEHVCKPPNNYFG